MAARRIIVTHEAVLGRLGNFPNFVREFLHRTNL
jgi:hypothetical protein